MTISVTVSFVAAVALVLPVILWCGASSRRSSRPATRQVLGGFVALATALFAAGVGFAYLEVLPGALAFLVGFDDHLYDVQIRASYYYSLVCLTLLAVGLAFQLPVAVLP